MTAWHVTIDYRSAVGGPLQRKETTVGAKLLSDAIENALDEWSMIHEEKGEFQITVVARS